MFCKNCGYKLDDDARFCPNCGTDMKPEEPKTTSTNPNPNPVPPVYAYPPKMEPTSNTLAIVGFVLSFCTLIAGLVCSIIAYKNCDKYDIPYKGLATAGIIISSIVTGLFVIIFIAIFFIFAAFAASLPMY